jgi:hypothetical protein
MSNSHYAIIHALLVRKGMAKSPCCLLWDIGTATMLQPSPMYVSEYRCGYVLIVHDQKKHSVSQYVALT